MAVIEMTDGLDPRSTTRTADRCPIARTFQTLGSKSAYMIMREAFYGATRFEEFVERTGVSEPVAAARLRDLAGAGLLAKRPYREPGQRTRSEYVLTEQGQDLLPVFVAMNSWGDKWLFPTGAGIRLTHAGCGEDVATTLSCADGHAVAPDQIVARPRRRRKRNAP